jgi:hypothetical protein
MLQVELTHGINAFGCKFYLCPICELQYGFLEHKNDVIHICNGIKYSMLNKKSSEFKNEHN